MKVLFINNSRGRGGGEEFLRDLLPGLAAKGITVGLICQCRIHRSQVCFKARPYTSTL